MKIDLVRRKRQSREEWHWRFAWFPVRVSETRLVWWEFYYCRLLCVAEGNWTGGDQWRWQTVEMGESKPYDHKLICN